MHIAVVPERSRPLYTATRRNLEQNRNIWIDLLPTPPWKQSHYPGKRHRLRDAAAEGQLVIVRCNLCRRTATYLATDLVALLDPARDALRPPFRCSKCGNEQFIRVSVRVPYAGDWGHLQVRRPGPVRVIQTWRTVRLGD